MEGLVLTGLALVLGLSFHQLGYKFSQARLQRIGVLIFSLLATLASLVTLRLQLELGIEYMYNLSLLALLIIASVSDLYSRTIEDLVILAFTILIVLLRILALRGLGSSLIQACLVFLILYAIYSLSRGSFGGGDVKIFFPLGLVFGLVRSLEVLFLASLLGLVYIGAGWLIRAIKNRAWPSPSSLRNYQLPFIPFICLASLLTYYIQVY